jgi:hypothetical protein
MKKIGLSLVFSFVFLCAVAQDYEPQKLAAATDTDVLLCFENMDLGVTALLTNVVPGEQEGQDLIIKSLNGKKFTIIGIDTVTLNEALDKDGKVLAYLVINYSIKIDRLKKVNKLIKNDEVPFSKLLNSLSESDFEKKVDGTTKAPDPMSFVKLRNAFVYNISVETSEGKKVFLQVFIENFTDAGEL